MYKTFLETVLPSQGTYVITGIVTKVSVKQKYGETLEQAFNLVEAFKKDPQTNIYFALSTFEGFSRKAEDSLYIKSFFLDLDVGKENNSYDTKEEADQAVAEDWEIDQRVMQEEIERGERDPDDIDQEPDYWITPCTVDENGCIRTPDDGLIYDPKTYVR